MAVKENALTALREQTTVDCDTMDEAVARELGPFEDCTSNQAIAFNELQNPKHKALIEESIQLAEKQQEKYPDVPVHELAVEIAMVKLQLKMLPLITGCVHVQVNPYDSYSKARIIQGANRITMFFKQLAPEVPTARLCIKIPATWEGLQACRELEPLGVKTLATTLFSMEQGALAGEVGCTYIAPYVNELKVHFDSSYKDESKLFNLCVDIQRYYEKHGYSTQVLPASLTSTDEISMLAGVHHITISPRLLQALTELPDMDDISMFGQPYSTCQLYGDKQEFMNDEAAYRLSFNRTGDGNAARKLGQAINIFCDMQRKMEDIMKPKVEEEIEA